MDMGHIESKRSLGKHQATYLRNLINFGETTITKRCHKEQILLSATKAGSCGEARNLRPEERSGCAALLSGNI